MKEIIKHLLERGDFVQSVAEEMGQELVRMQTENPWCPDDWNDKFYKTLQETVNNKVLEAVNDYMEHHNIESLIDTAVREYLVKNISDILRRNND